MGARTLFLGLVATAALASSLIEAGKPTATPTPVDDEVVWPVHFEGEPLTRLPLSAVEQRFADRFPGQIGRFTDGRRILILRAVQEPTRMLHSSAVCFRGLGYRLETPRAVQDAEGITWSCFGAERDGRRHLVCERIYDLRGQAWTDVSSWYWSAVLGRTERPWYALTVVSAQ
jgi:hypothetical protein